MELSICKIQTCKGTEVNRMKQSILVHSSSAASYRVPLNSLDHCLVNWYSVAYEPHSLGLHKNLTTF